MGIGPGYETPNRAAALALATFLSAWGVGGFSGPAAAAEARYRWPVRGPVIRPFVAPADPYAAGHRGIDIGAPVGTAVRAAEGGLVTFAGWIAGSLYVTIEHPDGLRTSYSWLSSHDVGRGDRVSRGDVIGRTGRGHREEARPHLHFSVRAGSTYIDPMLVLESATFVGVIRLAPLEGDGSDTQGNGDRAAWRWLRAIGGSGGGPPRMTAPVDRGCPPCSNPEFLPTPFVSLRPRGPAPPGAVE